MFKNSDSDIDIEDGHTHSGRVFREVTLVNLFKKNCGDEGLYSGDKAYLMDTEHSEPTGTKEGKAEEPPREEPKNSRTVQTAEVSTIIPPVDSVALINQSNPSH
jgi:hypothetical protein